MASLFQQNQSRLRIKQHLDSMRCCWPDWEGPRVEDSVHGRCSVHTCICHSITHNDTRYHYMAPCIIESISEDGNTIIAVVNYEPDSHCADMNGERLRLDITEVWPPTDELWELRHAEDLAEAKAAGTRCKCGGEIASKYGGTFVCQPCQDARQKELDEAIKPKRKKKKP
jgi:hypothetical protein